MATLREKLALKKLSEVYGYVVMAIATINAEYDNVNAQGIMPCPKCGGELSWSKNGGNGHTMGKCAKEGCMSWIQ